MEREVIVEIPVSPEAAVLLRDGHRARAAGLLLSGFIRPSSPETDPLTAIITEMKAEARADGLSDDDIDKELAAYNAERRF